MIELEKLLMKVRGYRLVHSFMETLVLLPRNSIFNSVILWLLKFCLSNEGCGLGESELYEPKTVNMHAFDI